MATEPGLILFGIVEWAVIIALYWLPTIIAARRHHRNTGMIAVIDGLLGWTIVGWVVALAISLGNPVSSQPTVVQHIYHSPSEAPPRQEP